MKIELTNKQYRDLITMSGIATGVFGILGDSLDGADYKKRSKKMDGVEEHLLSYAKKFDCEDLIENFEGKDLLNEEFYEEKISPILTDYEQFALYDGLAHELASRDFKRDHTAAEIKKMSKENGGYFGVEMYDYEKKYWDEFDKYDYDRLEILDHKEIN